ncbi:FimV/HubP family polar landmark protein [uncultured Thiodictyon sp.]|uniref:FimV/HubP family polar landmark protein n=1 Tax=uncultured Thiodictyon sp. TaxID=1846217 RepID=UPI0025ED6A68|nr:FimV/HubP family polar landmark protein [uncultured Thiodictyon sp.]
MSHKLCLAPALVLALASGSAHALGIGGIRLQSALDQPFVGEIDLVDVKPDELDGVKVQIAPQTEFSRAGTERYHYLTKLRFSPQISPRGNPVIRVSSKEPMREPYMDFLVEVVWPKGRLVKQYTVLLDPPVTTARSAPRVAPAVVDVRPPPSTPVRAAAPPEPTAPARPAKAAPPAAASPRARSAATPGGAFPIQIGPTRSGVGLWRLARANTPPGATVAQTTMALYRNNQDAFSNGDINRLIIGKILTLPYAGELFALSPEAAKAEFESAIKGGKVRRSPIAAPNAPVAFPGTGESRLRIAGAAGDGATPQPGAAAGAQDMEKELLLVREASESARQETVDLRSRIHDLESQLGEIQQLLKLRSEELARVQGGAGSAPGTLPGVTAMASPTASQTAPSAVLPVGAPGQAATGSAGPAGNTPTALTDAGTTTSPSAANAAPGAAGTLPAGTGATLQPRPAGALPAPAPVATKTPGQSPVAAGPKTPTPAVASASSDSTWQALLWPLLGVAGVTALGIGGLVWMRARRRVGSEDEFDALEHTAQGDAIPPVAPGEGDSAAISAGPPTIDLAAAGLEDSAPEQSRRSESTPDSEMALDGEIDEADILSEADIYIAYGRYREAEDLLRAEMRRTPLRLDLMFKLGEAFYGEQNAAALRGLMKEVQAVGGDRSSPAQWRRLCEMAAVNPADVTSSDIPASDLAADGLPQAVRATPVERGGAAWGDALASDDSESSGAGLSEVYTLDVGDMQASLPDLAMDAASSIGLDRAVLSGRGAAATDSMDGAPGAAARPFLPPTLMDESPFSLDLSLEKAFGGQPLDEALSGVGDAGAARADSALELNLDDALDRPSGEARVPDDLDRYLVLDAAATLPHSEDLTLTGGTALPPPVNRSPLRDPGTTPGSIGTPDDSEQLASAWQLDESGWDETATALDLARAYIEMGDQEAAKGILDEVVSEGSEEQRAAARELLKRVA